MEALTERGRAKPSRGLQNGLREWASRGSVFSVPQLEAREPVIERAFFITDSDGVARCQVVLVKSRIRRPLAGDASIRGQRMFQCVLKSEQGGRSVEIDLCELVRSIDPEVTIDLSDSTYAYYSPHEKRIVIRGMSNVFGVYTLLHELGHVIQSQDPRFQMIDRYYGLMDAYARQLAGGRSFPDISQLRRTITVIERASKILGLAERAEPFLARLAVLERRTTELDSSSRKEERSRCFIEGRELLEALKPILTLPQKILERDANNRMLRLLRYLKKMGINLFGAYIAQQESANGGVMEEGMCERSSMGAISRVTRFANANLATYQATGAHMRAGYGIPPPMTGTH